MNKLRYLFAPLLVALSFLTLLPVGVREPTDVEISRSRGWYPLVGLLYGLLLVGVLKLFVLIPPPFAFTLLAAALLTVIPALVNRFLHLDGLMDFCDAMWVVAPWNVVWRSCATPALGRSRWPAASAFCW